MTTTPAAGGDLAVGPLARIWMLVVIAVVLGPNLWAITGPHQRWPWDSGPMFAVTIDEDARLYRFQYTFEPQETRLKAKVFGLDDRTFSRHMFAHVYGSVDERFPDHHMVDDDREQFVARMTTFFSHVVAELRRKQALPAGTTGIRVAVVAVEPRGETHVVGRYDIATGRFVHTWGAP